MFFIQATSKLNPSECSETISDLKLYRDVSVYCFCDPKLLFLPKFQAIKRGFVCTLMHDTSWIYFLLQFEKTKQILLSCHRISQFILDFHKINYYRIVFFLNKTPYFQARILSGTLQTGTKGGLISNKRIYSGQHYGGTEI